MDKPFKLYQGYPQIAAVIGSAAAGRVNFMAAAWHGYLSHTPPLYGVSVSNKRFSHHLITEGGHFNCAFLPYESINPIHRAGRLSGAHKDKSGIFRSEPGSVIDIPRPAEAYAVLECRLINTVETGDHSLFIGEILHIYEQKGGFLENGLINHRVIRPALYIGADHYTTWDAAAVQHLTQDDLI